MSQARSCPVAPAGCASGRPPHRTPPGHPRRRRRSPPPPASSPVRPTSRHSTAPGRPPTGYTTGRRRVQAQVRPAARRSRPPAPAPARRTPPHILAAQAFDTSPARAPCPAWYNAGSVPARPRQSRHVPPRIPARRRTPAPPGTRTPTTAHTTAPALVSYEIPPPIPSKVALHRLHCGPAPVPQQVYVLAPRFPCQYSSPAMPGTPPVPPPRHHRNYRAGAYPYPPNHVQYCSPPKSPNPQ